MGRSVAELNYCTRSGLYLTGSLILVYTYEMLAKTGIKFGETSTRTNSQPTSPLCMESLTVILRYQTLSSPCSQIECFSTTRAKKISSGSKAQQLSPDRSIYFQLLTTCNGRLSIRNRRNSNRKASDYVRIMDDILLLESAYCSESCWEKDCGYQSYHHR